MEHIKRRHSLGFIIEQFQRKLQRLHNDGSSTGFLKSAWPSGPSQFHGEAQSGKLYQQRKAISTHLYCELLSPWGHREVKRRLGGRDLCRWYGLFVISDIVICKVLRSWHVAILRAEWRPANANSWTWNVSRNLWRWTGKQSTSFWSSLKAGPARAY